jgi:hypothetical protein
MRTMLSALWCESQIFAQPPAHHQRVMLVVDLALALFIPVLRRDHIHLHSHRCHPACGLIPKTPRLVAHHHLLGQIQLLAQPQKKDHRLKLLCWLRVALIDLSHHPVVPQVHVDPNLD